MPALKPAVLSLAALVLSSDLLAGEESTMGIFSKVRKDIDYDLNTLGLSGSLLTPVGLFRCEPEVLRGETRIDSFNNIVGISDVCEAEWKDFEAHNLECGYGANVALWDGELKGGVGFRDYLGRTEDKHSGEHIIIEGAGMPLEYESDQLNARINCSLPRFSRLFIRASSSVNA
jgi:hypothetical protein